MSVDAKPQVGNNAWLAGPHRVQLSRKAGAKLPPNTVVVSRPSKWGNPFRVTPERSQILAVSEFQTWLTVEGVTAGIADRKQWMLDNLKELRGKNLACWCKPGTACHADVLLRLANATGCDVRVEVDGPVGHAPDRCVKRRCQICKRLYLHDKKTLTTSAPCAYPTSKPSLYD